MAPMLPHAPFHRFQAAPLSRHGGAALKTDRLYQLQAFKQRIRLRPDLAAHSREFAGARGLRGDGRPSASDKLPAP